MQSGGMWIQPAECKPQLTESLKLVILVLIQKHLGLQVMNYFLRIIWAKHNNFMEEYCQPIKFGPLAT